MWHRLEWNLSIHCAACGYASEECGWGESPEAIRQVMIDTHGWFRIAPVTPAPSLVPVMKVLRQGESDPMTLAEATSLLR